MAQKVAVLLLDDLARQEDPESEIPADVTVAFSVGGEDFEIDLTRPNAEAFLAAIEPYRKAARPASKGGKKPARKSAPARPRPPALTREIRAWARQEGYEVRDRGRVPADIEAEYSKAVSGRHSKVVSGSS